MKQQLPAVRCAIYTRKSTDEGLDQEFNSLDAQRESGEAYIKSQQHEGWRCLPEHYDDGGFTGGNMERPALRRLMQDIEDGQVDCVVVYKVDRLSRSLLDFARMMETFERHRVSFVSVTQQFNTATSMGRLILNVLLSFAQFERELISERTRDKIAAARRRGKWCGRTPILGYDVVDKKLVVNQAEAERVREMFALYLQHESLLAVVDELARRGWKNKQRRTRKGVVVGGSAFHKANLHHLLRNVTYVGKIQHKDEVYEGEHPPIVEADMFQRVQRLLSRNGREGGREVRNRCGALLSGRLRCVACDCAMSHSFSTRGNRRYRYYVCTNAQKNGWKSCPAPSVPAGEIEQFVVNQIKVISRDPGLVTAAVRASRRQVEESKQALAREQSSLARQLGRDERDLRKLTSRGPLSGDAVDRLADLEERAGKARFRLGEIAVELATFEDGLMPADEAVAHLAAFDPVWDALAPRERTRLVQLLVQRIDFDGDAGGVAITFHPTGIRALESFAEAAT
ncbi:MAG: recombinase family protein [Pirellulaceae bacterium]